MALLDKRRRALAAEGLFAQERKRPLPFAPRVIGVVTSPTGAVIRDILHRLEDRFPSHVLLWPVPVQGEGAAEQVAAAVRGFGAIQPGGSVPRPDLIIVARGGGSVEDLWAFNEEVVVRAVAESPIPTISAVGHETDTSLCDFAADMRAPTPTAAAELAVPVRADLLATIRQLGHRTERCAARTVERAASGSRRCSATGPSARNCSPRSNSGSTTSPTASPAPCAAASTAPPPTSAAPPARCGRACSSAGWSGRRSDWPASPACASW
jgi:exodeoxyribonuclease VII large subunit